MTDQKLEADVAIEDRLIDGPHGPIPIRTYVPSAPTRGVVWVHGGAFAFGDIDQPESDWVARRLADHDTAVVTVDYRLAPVPEWASAALGIPIRDGVHFPVASEEIVTAFTWATTFLPDIAADSWSLGGASAGANLSAGAALRLRDQGGPIPETLLLSYGLFHASLPPLLPELAEKYAALPAELAVFSPDVVQLINVNYVGDPVSLASPYAFAGGHDLVGLPPALLINADMDSLRASGDEFGAELRRAGVSAVTVTENGTTHGYLDDPLLPAATRSIQRMVEWLDTASPAPSRTDAASPEDGS